MPLPQDFIEKLKDYNRIEDVMRQYVTLKRSGSGYKCLCPFHSERTPSCMVNPNDAYFHCFGCGAGGDVITFTMMIENLDYIEAVKLLAEKSGIPMPESGYSDRAQQNKKRLLEINQAAAKFFFSNLKTPDGRAGLSYLMQKRKLAPATIRSFGLGVAPNRWTSLTDHMLSLGYTKEELLAASLITEKNGKLYDFFVNRVMFPIFDLRGNVIAFSGRTLDSESKGMKYLNSRGTQVYEKSRVLFAMNFAKNTSVKTKRLILCEGNLDVISLHQAGFCEAVATCGTAITPEHARLMSQYCDEVYICYDADAAGRKATSAAINILTAAGLKAKVVRISGEGIKDVDDYIKKFGPEHFKVLLDSSEGAVAFELAKCREGLDTETDTGKVEYIRRAVEVLARIESGVERDVFISRVAHDEGFQKDVVAAEVDAYIKKRYRAEKTKEWKRIESGRINRDDINPEAAKFPKEAKAEEGIIAYILKHPDATGLILNKLRPENMVTPFNRKLYEIIEKTFENGEYATISTFGSELSPEEMGKISGIQEKLREIEIDSVVLEEYINVLLNAASKSTDNEVMSDDDLRNYAADLKKKKS